MGNDQSAPLEKVGAKSIKRRIPRAWILSGAPSRISMIIPTAPEGLNTKSKSSKDWCPFLIAGSTLRSGGKTDKKRNEDRKSLVVRFLTIDFGKEYTIPAFAWTTWAWGKFAWDSNLSASNDIRLAVSYDQSLWKRPTKIGKKLEWSE